MNAGINGCSTPLWVINSGNALSLRGTLTGYNGSMDARRQQALGLALLALLILLFIILRRFWSGA